MGLEGRLILVTSCCSDNSSVPSAFTILGLLFNNIFPPGPGLWSFLIHFLLGCPPCWEGNRSGSLP